MNLSNDVKLCLSVLLESGPQLFPMGQDAEAEKCLHLKLVTREPVRLLKATDRYTGYQYGLTTKGRQVAEALKLLEDHIFFL